MASSSSSSSSSARRLLSMQSWTIFLKTKQWSMSCPTARWNLQNWFLNLPMMVGGVVAFGSFTNPLVSMNSRASSSVCLRGVNTRSLLRLSRFIFSFCGKLGWNSLLFCLSYRSAWLPLLLLLSLRLMLAEEAKFAFFFGSRLFLTRVIPS